MCSQQNCKWNDHDGLHLFKQKCMKRTRIRREKVVKAQDQGSVRVSPSLTVFRIYPEVTERSVVEISCKGQWQIMWSKAHLCRHRGALRHKGWVGSPSLRHDPLPHFLPGLSKESLSLMGWGMHPHVGQWSSFSGSPHRPARSLAGIWDPLWDAREEHWNGDGLGRVQERSLSSSWPREGPGCQASCWGFCVVWESTEGSISVCMSLRGRYLQAHERSRASLWADSVSKDCYSRDPCCVCVGVCKVVCVHRITESQNHRITE